MNILQITLTLVVSTGFGDDQFYGEGGAYGRCLYVHSYRTVVKPINCEYDSIFDNMLLLRTLEYDLCKCSVILEPRYRLSNDQMHFLCQ